MTRHAFGKALAFAAIVALTPAAGSASGISIDTFSTIFSLNVSGASGSSGFLSASALGGRVRVASEGNGSVNATTASGVFEASVAPVGGLQTVSLSYGAILGLGGVDVTDGGAADRFLFDVVSTDQTFFFGITVTDTATASATRTGFVSGPASNQTASLLFSEFGGSVDLTSVDFLELSFDMLVTTDIKIDNVRTGGVDTPAVPLPASALLLGGGLAGLAGLRRRRRRT